MKSRIQCNLLIKTIIVSLLFMPLSILALYAGQKQPLCFTAKTYGATVTFNIRSGFTQTIQTSRTNNGTDWTDYTSGTPITLYNIGEKVYFRAANQHSKAFGASSFDFSHFQFSGDIEATGNIMSLYGPQCPDIRLPNNAFAYLFYNCSTLIAAPELPAVQLSRCCYSCMFRNCTSLSTAPVLPAINLSAADSCYSFMFGGCASLTAVPELPATTLSDWCYSCMFYGCSSLTTAPLLSATLLKKSCYWEMFGECTSLTSPPALMATTLWLNCYFGMFYGCTSLISAPLLQATSLNIGCYQNMFAHCTSLTSAPLLPATIMYSNCYTQMFDSCVSLTIPPVLSATTMATSCYSQMFEDCVSLIEAPELPATTLANQCYWMMFKGCSNLKMKATTPGKTWQIPSNATEADSWNYNMFSGTGGTFTGDPLTGVSYYIDTVRLVTAMANYANRGNVTGSGQYACLDTAILTATPMANYHFVRWSNGDTDSVIHIRVVKDTILTAYFESDSISSSAEVISNNSNTLLYPNPIHVGESAYINVDGEMQYIEVFSADGHCIQKIEQSTNNVAINELDVVGIYIVRITCVDGKIYIRKLIVE